MKNICRFFLWNLCKFDEPSIERRWKSYNASGKSLWETKISLIHHCLGQINDNLSTNTLIYINILIFMDELVSRSLSGGSACYLLRHGFKSVAKYICQALKVEMVVYCWSISIYIEANIVEYPIVMKFLGVDCDLFRWEI